MFDDKYYQVEDKQDVAEQQDLDMQLIHDQVDKVGFGDDEIVSDIEQVSEDEELIEKQRQRKQ